MAAKFGKHWLKAAAVIAATAEEQEKGGQEDALRGILRGAVHGRGMPVDWLHDGSSLLMVAASRGNIDCMNVLLDEFGAGPGAVEGAEAGSAGTSASEALRLAVDLDQAEAAAELLAWSEENAEEAKEAEVLDAEQMYENMMAKKEGRAPQVVGAAAAAAAAAAEPEPEPLPAAAPAEAAAETAAQQARQQRASQLSQQPGATYPVSIPPPQQVLPPGALSPAAGPPIIARGGYDEQVSILTRFYRTVGDTKSGADCRAIIDRRRNAGTPKGTPVSRIAIQIPFSIESHTFQGCFRFFFMTNITYCPERRYLLSNSQSCAISYGQSIISTR